MIAFCAPLAIGWRWLLLSGALAAVFVLGFSVGESRAGQKHIDYVAAEAAQSIRIVKAQAKVVTQTEIKYRDRIEKIYIQGEEIEKQVPILVTPADDVHLGVSTGFVRVYNAAWSRDPAGSAAESDREPAGIPLAAIAETEAANATSCRAWREQAIGLREFYERLQLTVNGVTK